MDPTPIELIPIISIILSFAAAITIVVVIAKARTRRLEMQIDLQSKLIEKFGSSAELVAFLQSDAGKAFVTGVQRGPARMTRERAFGSMRVGIFFTAIGVAFLALWGIDRNDGLAWPGVFMFVLGAAYFASAYSMKRASDVLADRAEGPNAPRPPALG